MPLLKTTALDDIDAANSFTVRPALCHATFSTMGNSAVNKVEPRLKPKLTEGNLPPKQHVCLTESAYVNTSVAWLHVGVKPMKRWEIYIKRLLIN